MTRRFLVALMCVAVSPALFAQDKAADRLTASTFVLKTILEKQGIPTAMFDKAACVLVYPDVKKVGVGIGVTRGRGMITCRSGAGMTGAWSAPAMYTLDAGSLGLQIGGSATDYVLLVVSDRGANKMLAGKIKIGADASAVAGPTGAQAGVFNDPNVDVLAYSQAKGLFAGASVSGVSMESDNDMNLDLYGKALTAKEIVTSATPVPPAGRDLIGVLNKLSPARK